MMRFKDLKRDAFFRFTNEPTIYHKIDTHSYVENQGWIEEIDDPNRPVRVLIRSKDLFRAFVQSEEHKRFNDEWCSRTMDGEVRSFVAYEKAMGKLFQEWYRRQCELDDGAFEASYRSQCELDDDTSFDPSVPEDDS